MLRVTLQTRPQIDRIEHPPDLGLVQPLGDGVERLARRHVEDGPGEARDGVAVALNDII
jgi:hypothetical protein